MSAVAATPSPTVTVAPKPPAKVVEDKGIELKDLRRNPEGIVSVEPRVEVTQLCTVVTGRKFLGYGGPLAVEDIEGRGTFKCLGDDGLYELSDGGQYVLPHNLAEALGITIPEASPAEVAAMSGKLDEYEAEQAEKARKDAETRGKKVETPAHTTPAPTPTR